MRILFDHQAFEMQRFGGVSNSYAELIAHLRNAGCECRISLKESDNVHLQECGLGKGVKPLYYTHNLLFEGRKRFKGQRVLAEALLKMAGHGNRGRNINVDYSIRQLKRQRYDIFEPTFFDPYFLPYLKGKPLVLTVHDMTPELLGIDAQQAANKRQVCPLATHIHVPSENTKKDLVNIMGIKPEKVSVIPHGAPQVPTEHHPSPFPFPYLLYVGARWGYKNFDLFVEECAIAISKIPDLHVVCTGQPFQKDEEKVLAEHRLTECFIHHYTDAQGLQALYQNAVAFVYPSAYEGFGMPILEAFVCGCPVMLNNASCFPEVGGDAAIYFDINSRGNLAEHIDAFIGSATEDREHLIARGYERAKLFSWERSASLLTEQYQKIAAA